MELAAAGGAARDPPLAAVASAPSAGMLNLNVVVVGDQDDKEAAEVRAVDLHGNVIKRIQIRGPIVGPLSVHGNLLCASHGWGLTSVVDMATGAVKDVAADPRKKVNSATPYCLLGHVPATGEYKVLRLQADSLRRRWRQTCEVMTLGCGGGGGDAGTWRRRTPPLVTLSIEPGSSSGNVAVVAGLAYFLVCWGRGDDGELNIEADSIAVFDMAAEEWRPATLRGPLTTSLLAGTDGEDVHTKPYHRRRHPPLWYSFESLRRRFQLARLGNSLVVVYCNVEDTSTELWFLEDMGGSGDTAAPPRWSRRYTLRCTPFAEEQPRVHNFFRISAVVQQYHYPLAVLDDGRILVWVDRMSALRAYDPDTSMWTDLATLTGRSVAGLHHGRPLCSNHTYYRPRFGSCTIL